ncbi:MAG TPA: hypothetical protein PLN25_05385 [Deltaproteobacteria bacterium]|nr:hypothetical protein [Deltaproteobacteria bacterium]HQB38860.1 hypothetical protein [Deltaproteobacteria bacterium]
MALVNHAKREINAKIVYYGAERTGKSTSLRYVYDRVKPTLRGEMKLLPASGSSLLFFDFSPFEQPVFEGYRLRMHIYTLQGTVANPAAWRMTLKGADGIVIVADASPSELFSARQSIQQLKEYLNGYGMSLNEMPYVLQLNKSDIYGQASAGDMAGAMGLSGCLASLTSATNGTGVLEGLTALSRLIMDRLGERDDLPNKADKADSAVSSAQENGAHTSEESVLPVSSAPLAPVDLELSDEMVVPDGHTLAAVDVEVIQGDISVDGGLVRIPLHVSHSGQRRRLVVTLSVTEE